MTLHLSESRTISEIQEEFSAVYPYLKLEFYHIHLTDPELPIRKHLPNILSLRAAGLKNSGEFSIDEEMTVAETERIFQQNFGLSVQVCRQSGIVWLETTMTDKWTLKKQNDQGRDLSLVQQPYSVK